jgi:hypothetical protein
VRRTRLLLVAMMAAGLLATAAPAASAADGYLHAWQHSNRGGFHCAWLYDADNWGACRNQMSSLHNTGYPGSYDDVNLYWDVNRLGSWACIPNGAYWSNLHNYQFNRGATGSPGRGERLNDNISSHEWVDACP